MMKFLRRILVYLLTIILVLLVLIFLQAVNPDQRAENHPLSLSPVYSYDSLQNELSVDSLQQLFGANKFLPEGYELQALIALAAYPDLKDVKVSFELTQDGAPMESNFEISTLFGSRANRHYRILLNDSEGTAMDPILLRSLPFDAQVGILAHELGHASYYHQLNTLGVANWGLQYLISSNFRARHERTTDLVPLYRGLGLQIYHYAYFVRNDDTTRPLYNSFGAEFIDKYYMTDEEIREELLASPKYRGLSRNLP